MKLLWRTLVRGAYKTVGLDSPYASQEYGVNWSKQRAKCLERDGHACRVCGATPDELDGTLAIHHITPRSAFDGTPREMNALNNLVTLCPSCHGSLEGKYTQASVDEFVSEARGENF